VQLFHCLQSMPGFRIPGKFLVILWMFFGNQTANVSRDTSTVRHHSEKLVEIHPTPSLQRKWFPRLNPRNGRADNVAKTAIREVSLTGRNFGAKLQKPSKKKNQRGHRYLLYYVINLWFFDSSVSFSRDSSHVRQTRVYSYCHRSIVSYHLTVCSSTLLRFVFSAESKLKHIFRPNHIWPNTTNGNNANNQSEFKQHALSSVKRGKTRDTTTFGLILIG